MKLTILCHSLKLGILRENMELDALKLARQSEKLHLKSFG